MNNKELKNKGRTTVMANFDLWILLDQTRFAISRSRELELAHFGLTLTQAGILLFLENSGGEATLYEISKSTMKQHNSVSTLIKRMIEHGLIKKVKNPGDNKIRVAITPKGKELYGKAPRSSIDMIFSSLSSEQKQELASCLKVLRKKSRNLLGVDYKPPFLQE